MARLAGALLPQKLYNYLLIYTLAKNVTKTQVIKDLLEEWMQSKREEEPDEVLLLQIAERYTRQWNVQKISHPESDFKEFKSDVQRQLLNKDMPDTYVQLILIKIKK